MKTMDDEKEKILTHEDYVEGMSELDGNINVFLLLFSLNLGFILTIYVSIFLEKSSIDFLLWLLLFLLMIENVVGLSWGIYLVSHPNDVRFIKDLEMEKTFQITRVLIKANKLNQADYFRKFNKQYKVLRQLCWITIGTVLITLIYFIVNLAFFL